MTSESGPQTPAPGQVYRASDGRWYRWPNPTPYPTREAAESRDAWAVSATPLPRAPYQQARADWVDETSKRGVGRATVWLAVVFLGGPIVVGAISFLVLPKHVERGCEGIGFGCTLPPAENALLVAGFVTAVAVPVVAFAALVMRLLAGQSSWFRALSAPAKAAAVTGLFVGVFLAIRLLALVVHLSS